MVQPKYSPEEALQRIKLMMEYDSSKTLDENKKVISEQVDPTSATLGTLGAGTGFVAGTAFAAGAAAGTTVFPVVGTAIGALVGLGLGALGNWIDNKDKGREAFGELMKACSATGASKLVPKMSKSDIRNLAYSIEDAKGDWNDDEDAIVATLQKVESIADLCALDKKVTGGLFKFLDDLTDSPDEWKMFTRPIAGMIEDSEIVLTPEEQKKTGTRGGNSGGGGGSKTGGYKPCTGTYKKGCKSDVIAKVQGCLSLVTDGKFGPKTQAALSAKGFETFTDADVAKICQSKPTEVEPEISGEEQRISGNTDF
jgi:hypothetical protein